jgi:hypothetical protein
LYLYTFIYLKPFLSTQGCVDLHECQELAQLRLPHGCRLECGPHRFFFRSVAVETGGFHNVSTLGGRWWNHLCFWVGHILFWHSEWTSLDREGLTNVDNAIRINLAVTTSVTMRCQDRNDGNCKGNPAPKWRVFQWWWGSTILWKSTQNHEPCSDVLTVMMVHLSLTPFL